VEYSLSWEADCHSAGQELTTNKHYEAGSFLRSQQSLNWPINFPAFTDTEDLFPCSQVSSSWRNHEQSSPILTIQRIYRYLVSVLSVAYPGRLVRPSVRSAFDDAWFRLSGISFVECFALYCIPESRSDTLSIGHECLRTRTASNIIVTWEDFSLDNQTFWHGKVHFSIYGLYNDAVSTSGCNRMIRWLVHNELEGIW
jgi:hypothetical protein